MCDREKEWAEVAEGRWTEWPGTSVWRGECWHRCAPELRGSRGLGRDSLQGRPGLCWVLRLPEHLCMGGSRDRTEKKYLALQELNLFFPLETDSNKGSLEGGERYLDLPNGSLSVDGDGGVPAPPPGGGATQRGQCGCRQARQVTRPLEHGKNQTQF